MKDPSTSAALFIKSGIGCPKEHFIRATLESIACQTSDVLRIKEQDSGVCLKNLKVDGGAGCGSSGRACSGVMEG